MFCHKLENKHGLLSLYDEWNSTSLLGIRPPAYNPKLLSPYLGCNLIHFNNAGHAGQPAKFLFTRRGMSQPKIVAVGIYETENYIIAHSFETRVREKKLSTSDHYRHSVTDHAGAGRI